MEQIQREVARTPSTATAVVVAFCDTDGLWSLVHKGSETVQRQASTFHHYGRQSKVVNKADVVTTVPHIEHQCNRSDRDK